MDSLPSMTWWPVNHSRTATAENPRNPMTAPKLARHRARREPRATTPARSPRYRSTSNRSRTYDLTTRIPPSASSAVAVLCAMASWTSVLTRSSGRPKISATASSAGAARTATMSSVGLSVNRITMDPMRPMTDESIDVVVCVSIVRTSVTSLERRLTSSPTRLREWKSSERLTRLANSWPRIWATIRSPTTPRKYAWTKLPTDWARNRTNSAPIRRSSPAESPPATTCVTSPAPTSGTRSASPEPTRSPRIASVNGSPCGRRYPKSRRQGTPLLTVPRTRRRTSPGVLGVPGLGITLGASIGGSCHLEHRRRARRHRGADGQPGIVTGRPSPRAGIERRLARLQRTEPERRPRVVHGDLRDRPEAVLGEERPQRVTVHVGPIALRVHDPERGRAAERRAVGGQRGAHVGATLDDDDRDVGAGGRRHERGSLGQRTEQPRPRRLRDPGAPAWPPQQLLGDRLAGHQADAGATFWLRRNRLSMGPVTRAPIASGSIGAGRDAVRATVPSSGARCAVADHDAGRPRDRSTGEPPVARTGRLEGTSRTAAETTDRHDIACCAARRHLEGGLHPRWRRRASRLAGARAAVRRVARPRHLGRAVGGAPRGGREPVVRPCRVAQRRPRRDVDAFVGGPHLWR